MKKHAYLIIANGHFNQLKILLSFIDDVRNDIYLMIDGKVIIKSEFKQELRSFVKKSNFYFVNPIKISWGAFSQIEAELILMEMASKREYGYYHLLSGMDLPIKSQDYIHRLCDNSGDKEFIEVNDFHLHDNGKKFLMRYEQYHFLQEKIGKSRGLLKYIDFSLVYLQYYLGINRVKNSDIVFKSGSNWVSITHQLVMYVLKKREWIKSVFKNSYCCDEVFLSTLVFNSKFRSRIYQAKDIYSSNLRLYTFINHNPKVYGVADFKMLNGSEALFARKFDIETDPNIIKSLFDLTNTGKEREFNEIMEEL